MRSLNSHISFYIYLEDENEKTLIKTLDLGYSLGIENVKSDTKQPSIKALCLSLIRVVCHRALPE